MNLYLLSTLQSINLGELFSSLILVIAAIFAIHEVVKKLSGIFSELYNKKSNDEDKDEMLYRHDSELKTINSKLDTIIEKLNTQDKLTNEANIINFKYDLYKIYEKCAEKGYSTEEELRCYIEKEKIYTKSGGNDFIHDKITPFMMALPNKAPSYK